MKIFLDTALVDDIARRNDGLISGVTTNPTLIAKSGRTPHEVYQEIFDLGIKDLSIEVEGEYFDELIAHSTSTVQTYADYATIKLPCTVEGIKACKKLSILGHKTNMTLVFSVSQAILCAKAGATYVSPFVGRLDQIGEDGINLIRDISRIYCVSGVKTQILAASIRSPKQAEDAYLAGADICTLPVKVFDQMFRHSLTDDGLKQFAVDFGINF